MSMLCYLVYIFSVIYGLICKKSIEIKYTTIFYLKKLNNSVSIYGNISKIICTVVSQMLEAFSSLLTLKNT